MKASFSVLDEGWIPVAAMDGTTSLLGIRKTLQRAHKIREISVASPLEEYSLYRFLCVFLMDALRPKRLSAIRKLLEQGQFDPEPIEQYITACAGEGVTFDLFDEKQPFMQAAFDPELEKELKPVGYLDPMLPTGNNHVHFDHRKGNTVSLSPGEAARKLLSIQQFCTAGVKEYPSGVNASPPYFCIVRGENLFETLVYTLCPLNEIGIPFDEPPVLWRSRTQITPKMEIGETSWLRGMFFPARRIHLTPGEDGRISQIYLCQGENYKNKESWKDPFVTYRVLQNGIAPLRPNGEKPIWRSFCEIISIPGQHASQILQHYLQLRDTVETKIVLYGVETNQASYVGLYRHELQFPSAIASREPIISLLQQCITSAEDLSRALKHSLADTGVIPDGITSGTIAAFYARCETDFWSLCKRSASMQDEEIGQAYQNWCGQISMHARNAWQDTVKNLRLRGRALGAVADNQRRLLYAINKIKEEAGNG